MEGSSVVTDEEKAKIRQIYPKKVTQDGEFLVECQVFRSQTKNKARVIERLHQLVVRALVPEKKRIPTKTPKWAKRKRIEEKREHGEKKKLRQKPKLDF
jgi:ribosome-associated protein